MLSAVPPSRAHVKKALQHLKAASLQQHRRSIKPLRACLANPGDGTLRIQVSLPGNASRPVSFDFLELTKTLHLKDAKALVCALLRHNLALNGHTRSEFRAAYTSWMKAELQQIAWSARPAAIKLQLY